MIYNNLFLDSDVILDLLFERIPFSKYSAVLIAECAVNKIKLSTSALIIANVNYIAAKKLGKATTILKLKSLIKRIQVLSFESDAIDFAVNSSFTDFEDAIQHHIATKNNCEAIITRNTKDYKHATIPVLTAEQFLRTIIK